MITSDIPPGPRSVSAAAERNELEEGFLKLLRRVCMQVATGRPTFAGSMTWNTEEIDDLAFETIKAIGTARLVTVASQARTDAEFGSYLRQAARHVLDMRGRKTPAGWVARTMDDALAADNHFTAANRSWRLTSHTEAQPAYEGPTRALVEVAQTIETRMVVWNPKSKRGAPLAYPADITSVCAAVLARFGPVARPQLAEMLAHRFNVSFSASYCDPLPITSTDEWNEPPTAEQGTGIVDDEDAGAWIVGQLHEDEVSVLALVHDGQSIEQAAESMGWGRTKAYDIRTRINEKLTRLASAVEDTDGTIVAIAMEICSGLSADFRHSEE